MKPIVRIARNGFLAAAMVLPANVASATPNGSAGIFLTAADYQNGRLTDEGDCASPNHKIELHDVLNKPYIHVRHDGVRRQYMKRDVYGFRSCDGRDFRFVGKDEYEILEAREVSIYVLRLPDQEGEDLVVGPIKRNAYFFSAGVAGAVLRLTRENLKRAFPGNHRFHDALDQTFRSDSELAQYDDFHKMYKVNRLLRASVVQ